MKQERYEVTGMTCSACSSRVEKCVSKIDGVENVSVNLLTNSMQVSYDENKVNEDIIVSEVEKAGYGAAPANAGNEKRTDKGKKTNKAEQEIHEMKIRLIWSIIFLIPMMYISMHHMFYEWFGILKPSVIASHTCSSRKACGLDEPYPVCSLRALCKNRCYLFCAGRVFGVILCAGYLAVFDLLLVILHYIVELDDLIGLAH